MSRGTKNIAFGWYGGKFSHLDWLLPLLPQTEHFCDVYGGSAAVTINRRPSAVETYNDIDTELVNFFRVLRNNHEELIRQIGLTPFSKQELREACGEQDGSLSDVERARRFYVRARQVRTGLAQTASEGRWAHCTLTSRAGMAGAVSRWLGAVEALPEIAQRLLRVQIENDTAVNIIKRYDTAETLFYCDPPYVHSTRGDSKAYGHELTDTMHRELATALNGVKGKVAVSGYHSPLYDELFHGWYRTEGDSKMIHSTKDERMEVLWTNYDPAPVIIENQRLLEEELKVAKSAKAAQKGAKGKAKVTPIEIEKQQLAEQTQALIIEAIKEPVPVVTKTKAKPTKKKEWNQEKSSIPLFD